MAILCVYECNVHACMCIQRASLAIVIQSHNQSHIHAYIVGSVKKRAKFFSFCYLYMQARSICAVLIEKSIPQIHSGASVDEAL